MNHCGINAKCTTSYGGTKLWWLNGKLHREDGPAVEFADGSKLWYIYGERIHVETNEQFLRIMSLRAFW